MIICVGTYIVVVKVIRTLICGYPFESVFINFIRHDIMFPTIEICYFAYSYETYD